MVIPRRSGNQYVRRRSHPLRFDEMEVLALRRASSGAGILQLLTAESDDVYGHEVPGHRQGRAGIDRRAGVVQRTGARATSPCLDVERMKRQTDSGRKAADWRSRWRAATLRLRRDSRVDDAQFLAVWVLSPSSAKPDRRTPVAARRRRRPCNRSSPYIAQAMPVRFMRITLASRKNSSWSHGEVDGPRPSIDRWSSVTAFCRQFSTVPIGMPVRAGEAPSSTAASFPTVRRRSHAQANRLVNALAHRAGFALFTHVLQGLARRFLG